MLELVSGTTAAMIVAIIWGAWMISRRHDAEQRLEVAMLEKRTYADRLQTALLTIEKQGRTIGILRASLRQTYQESRRGQA